jgi:hypothetical protein
MVGEKIPAAVAHDDLAVSLPDAPLIPQHLLLGHSPQQDDDLRGHQLDLLVEPGLLAGVQLPGMGRAVAGRPAFDARSNVDFRTLESGGFQQSVQESPGRPDERPAQPILLGAGRLAEEEDLGAHRTFSRDRVGPARVEWTLHADPDSFVELAHSSLSLLLGHDGKSEIRNSKSETNPKPKILMTKTYCRLRPF